MARLTAKLYKCDPDKNEICKGKRKAQQCYYADGPCERTIYRQYAADTDDYIVAPIKISRKIKNV